ncbi:MAG: oligosaccharide flippase family protein, partial [Myxococcaceae bacterium]
MPSLARDDGGANFLRRAGPLVFARLIGAGITFVIPLVLARAMALEEYGTYKQLFLISQTLQYTLPFGVAQSLYFFIPRTDQPRPWVAQSLVFLLFAGMLGATLVFTLSNEVSDLLGNPDLLRFRTELALYVFGLVAASALEIILTGQGRTKAAARIYLGTDLIRACAMVIPVFLGYGLAGAMRATVAVALLRAVVTWVTLFTATTGPLFRPEGVRTQLAWAAPFGAAMLLNVPQQNAHQYAVGSVVPPELFAIYAVGCFQLPLVDLLYTPTSEVLMVRVGELERQGRVSESVQAFREAAGRLAYFFLPTAAFLFVAAPEFIGALFGAKFLPAVPLFRVSVLGIALAILP